MKKTIICVLLAIPLLKLSAQSDKAAITAFSRLNKALNEISKVSYDIEMYVHNPQENYFYKGNIQTYAEFEPQTTANLQKVILAGKEYSRIFNGTELFNLNHTDKTYELDKVNATARHLSSSSGLGNSIICLKVALPEVIKDESIIKTVADTVVENKKYKALKFSLTGKVLDFPSAFHVFKNSPVVQYYVILVDPKTALPYRVTQSNSATKDYYYQVTLNNLKTRPAAPPANEWFYSGYAGYTQKVKKEQVELIAVGQKMTDWKLPMYHADADKTDSIDTESLKGKLTVIEFWIKNCGYCMLAFEDMKKLQEKYAGSDVEIVSINAYDSREDVGFFHKRDKVAYKMLYNGTALAESLGVYGYPKTIILNENNEVVYTASGFNGEKVSGFIDKYKKD